jgi:hypothetical protein
LDRGNPNPGNIGSDFNRFGLAFWHEVDHQDSRNAARQVLLVELNEWRNAIAHQDFNPAVLGGSTRLPLVQVKAWRNACHGLAIAFDTVMHDWLQSLTGTAPW